MMYAGEEMLVTSTVCCLALAAQSMTGLILPRSASAFGTGAGAGVGEAGGPSEL